MSGNPWTRAVRYHRSVRVPASKPEPEPAIDRSGFTECVGGPMDRALVDLRPAYTTIRLPAAPDGEYRRTHIDVDRWEYRWVERETEPLIADDEAASAAMRIAIQSVDWWRR